MTPPRHPFSRRGLGRKLIYWLAATAFTFALLAMIEQHEEVVFEDQIIQAESSLHRELSLVQLLLQALSDQGSNRLFIDLDVGSFHKLYSPAIVAAGFQQAIPLAEREQLETRLSYQNRQPFLIRDYRDWSSATWIGNGSWVPAPARNQYLPLLSLYPTANGSRLQDLSGLDVLSDPFLGDAALKAWQSPGKVFRSRPFSLQDNSPGVAYLRATDKSGLAIVFVDASQLINVNAKLAELAIHPAAYQAKKGTEALISGKQLPLELPYTLTLHPHKLSPLELLVFFFFVGLACLSLFIALFNTRSAQARPKVLPRTNADILSRHALQSLPSAVLVFSERMQIRYANDVAIALSGDDRLIGKLSAGLDFGLFYMQDERRISLINAMAEQRKPAIFPPRSFLIDASGMRHDIEGEFSLLPNDSDPTLRGYVFSFRQLANVRKGSDAEIHKLQEQLQKHQDELARIARINTLGEMSSGVAHEINQPLSAIMSYNEACLAMLDDVNPDPVLLRISLSSSVKQANRAGKIIRRLRELASRKQPVLAPLDINELLTGSIALVQNELDSRQIELTTDLGKLLPLVRGDNIQLEQVVINLIKNAMDAMQQQPRKQLNRIFAYTEQRGRHIRIGIRDNGPGMPENVLPHVFDPFYSSKSDGMGLGLTISQTIVESIGGRLSARNLETGGAEFAITLPALRDEADDNHEENA